MSVRYRSLSGVPAVTHVRHGVSLMAAMNVADGTIRSKTITRNNSDMFVAFLTKIDQTPPALPLDPGDIDTERVDSRRSTSCTSIPPNPAGHGKRPLNPMCEGQD